MDVQLPMSDYNRLIHMKGLLVSTTAVLSHLINNMTLDPDDRAEIEGLIEESRKSTNLPLPNYLRFGATKKG